MQVKSLKTLNTGASRFIMGQTYRAKKVGAFWRVSDGKRTSEEFSEKAFEDQFVKK